MTYRRTSTDSRDTDRQCRTVSRHIDRQTIDRHTETDKHAYKATPANNVNTKLYKMPRRHIYLGLFSSHLPQSLPIPRIPNRASFLHHSRSLHPTRLTLGAAVAIQQAFHSGIAPGNDGLGKVTFHPTLNSLDEFTAILPHHPTDINNPGRWAPAVRRFIHRVCPLEPGEQLQLQLLSPPQLKAIYNEQLFIDVLLLFSSPATAAGSNKYTICTTNTINCSGTRLPSLLSPFSFPVTFARLAIP